MLTMHTIQFSSSAHSFIVHNYSYHITNFGQFFNKELESEMNDIHRLKKRDINYTRDMIKHHLIINRISF